MAHLSERTSRTKFEGARKFCYSTRNNKEKTIYANYDITSEAVSVRGVIAFVVVIMLPLVAIELYLSTKTTGLLTVLAGMGVAAVALLSIVSVSVAACDKSNWKHAMECNETESDIETV